MQQFSPVQPRQSAPNSSTALLSPPLWDETLIKLGENFRHVNNKQPLPFVALMIANSFPVPPGGGGQLAQVYLTSPSFPSPERSLFHSSAAFTRCNLKIARYLRFVKMNCAKVSRDPSPRCKVRPASKVNCTPEATGSGRSFLGE